MINYNVVCIVSCHADMLLFLDRSLINNCYVCLCNSCNVVSYKAVTVVFFAEHRRNRVAVERLIKIQQAYAI